MKNSYKVFVGSVAVFCFGCMLPFASLASDQFEWKATQIDFPKAQSLGISDAGDEIYLGGFSGLTYTGQKTKAGHPILWTHTDRGPNAEPYKNNGKKYRLFPLPDFQPMWVKFSVDLDQKQVEIIETTSLVGLQGKPISGIPNDPVHDEIPSDLKLQAVQYDPYGLDLEGITVASNGDVWMADEYRPSLVQFSAQGKMLSRYIPQGSNSTRDNMGLEVLSSMYASRKKNRGFEAISVVGTKLYAFLQSPLPGKKNNKKMIRIIAFDTQTQKETGQYIYMLDNIKADKIGGMAYLGANSFLVIERDGKKGSKSFKKIYQIDMGQASNLLDLPKRKRKNIAKWSSKKLYRRDISPVRKTLFVDLVKLGIGHIEKIEGITVLDKHTVAIINDNDFSLEGGFDPSTGKLAQTKAPENSSVIILTTSQAIY